MVEQVRSTWSVTFTLPPKEQTRWVQNRHYNVVAASVERALETVRKSHPDCTFVSITKTGRNSNTLVDTDE